MPCSLDLSTAGMYIGEGYGKPYNTLMLHCLGVHLVVRACKDGSRWQLLDSHRLLYDKQVQQSCTPIMMVNRSE